MIELRERVAIVTGAAQGIGRGTATCLLQAGASVVLADIHLERAQDAAAGLERETGAVGRTLALQTDVGDPASVVAMVTAAAEWQNRIDILVNNAGIIDTGTVLDISADGWDRVLDVDLRGAQFCAQACLPHMIRRQYGRIINIASMAGQIGGLKVGPAYTAAKAGVIALAKSYARFSAPHNITANSICPGFIETELTRGRDDPAGVPLGRLGTPLDVGGAVLFFASELAGYITGANLNVNGGLYMGP